VEVRSHRVERGLGQCRGAAHSLVTGERTADAEGHAEMDEGETGGLGDGRACRARSSRTGSAPRPAVRSRLRTLATGSADGRSGASQSGRALRPPRVPADTSEAQACAMAASGLARCRPVLVSRRYCRNRKAPGSI
jgi:hypothetical protein